MPGCCAAPVAGCGRCLAAEPSLPPAPGVNLIGYLSSERGLGEVARQILATLQAGGVATAPIEVPTDGARFPEELAGLGADDHPYDFNLICVNADMLPGLAAAGAGLFADRLTAGLWFWEVPRFPERWHGSFRLVDEVWVASDYIAEALRPISPVPVQTVRLPIAPPQPARLSRSELGMPAGFCFLFVFDYRSVFDRKNPLGVVQAFRAAFEPGEGPSLVIKSVSGDEFPEQRQALAEAIDDRPEIHLIEEIVPADLKNAMIASCDCYVSLHRSEGLGLTMAEAMYFGRPVIATAYSGNLDFMTAENGFLVPHAMVEIGPDAAPYPADLEWADPDLAHASRLMSEVFEDRSAAAEKGRRAAADIRMTHSPRAAREGIEARLSDARRRDLLSRLGPADAAKVAAGIPAGSRDRLEYLVGLGDAPARDGSGGPRAVAKRLYLRLLRPYAAHQQRLHVGIAESLDELREQLGESLRLQAATIREAEKRERWTREQIVALEAKLAAAESALRKLADDA